jgi:SAM-dependent methyltransferase
MNYSRIQRLLPRFLSRYVRYFEASTQDAVSEFAGRLAGRAMVLDAGAGETVYARFFSRQRYCAVDLGVGNAAWDYGNLDAVADLARLPFRDGSFDACLNVVTLEHVREPAAVLAELRRVLKPSGRLLLIVPQEWEVHQAPHDYYRYTRFGVEYLLGKSGFEVSEIRPVGGYFRLLARRLLNGLQFFPGVFFFLAALFLVPPALVLPWIDWLDRERNFTLGYICSARPRS